MQVERIHDLDALRQLTDQWNCLSRGVPFRSHQWLASWWENYRAEGELYLLAVRSNETLVGLAPWYRARSLANGLVLRQLGSGEVCTDYLSLLATEEHEKRVVSAIADWLVNEDNTWDFLELTGVDESDQMTANLVARLEAGGCGLHQQPGLNCWRIDLPETWEEYVASLSKSHRKQVRRVERRLLDEGRAVLNTAESGEQLTQAMEILVDLHQRRRKSLGEPGCFASDRFSAFLHQAAERLFDKGLLRLHWVELDDRAVAAEFHVCGGGVTYAYQAGVDPDAMDDEPGRLINIATIKAAIEDQQQAFDFLRGDEPYKAHWRAQCRPAVEYRVAANHATAQLRHAVWLAGTRMKDWIKDSLSFVGAH